MNEKIKNLEILVGLLNSGSITRIQFDILKKDLFPEDNKKPQNREDFKNHNSKSKEREELSPILRFLMGAVCILFVIILVVNLFKSVNNMYSAKQDLNAPEISPELNQTNPSNGEKSSSNNNTTVLQTSPSTPELNQTNPYSKEQSSSNDISSYLINHTFTFKNGNGFIEFSNGTMIIKGGRATIQGDYEVNGDNSATITGLQAIYGDFDASNNTSSSGIMYLNTDGSLEISLSDGMDNRSYTLIPK